MMGLDVYLIEPIQLPAKEREAVVYVRENGEFRRLTEQEYDIRFPEHEPVFIYKDSNIVFESYITHNLGAMAKEVNLYLPIWRPEEIDVRLAEDVTPYLEVGIKRMMDESERLVRDFNPKNNWGSFHGFFIFVRDYLDACKKYPYSLIDVSR